MKTFSYALVLISACACAQTPPAPPQEPKPVVEAVAARTGWLLQQLEQKDLALSEAKKALSEEKTRSAGLVREIAALKAQNLMLQRDFKQAEENLKTHRATVAKVLQKEGSCWREVEILKQERDQCYVELATQMIPLASTSPQ